MIILAIIAAVLMATFNFGFGAELTFNQSLAVCMYASLPGILKALIAMLAIGVGGGESFTFQNPVASNLSGLVDPSSHFLYSIATSLDIITIWTLVLTGIGFACLTKVKRGACLGVVFGWWAWWCWRGRESQPHSPRGMYAGAGICISKSSTRLRLRQNVPRILPQMGTSEKHEGRRSAAGAAN